MEPALALFVSQWHSLLLRYQIREVEPSLGDLVEEYDRVVVYVDSIHPGFLGFLSVQGSGLFLPIAPEVVPEGFRIRPAWGGEPARLVVAPPEDVAMDAVEVVLTQEGGESTSEVYHMLAASEVQRVEDIIDLTLD